MRDDKEAKVRLYDVLVASELTNARCFAIIM